jgi:predicted aconitase with swiveling domain
MADGRVLLAGAARGRVLVLDEPLSMWGGLDPETGLIVDRRHPQLGASLAAVVVVMPFGRGSSSSSSVLAEAIRLGTAPAAILLREPDEILMLGALVARDLYGIACPIVVLGESDYDALCTGDVVKVDEAGAVEPA